MTLHLPAKYKTISFLSIFCFALHSITLTSMEPVLISSNQNELPRLTQYTKYKPLELNMSEENKQIRAYIDTLTDSLSKYTSEHISTYYIEKPGERLETCINYALRSIFEITKDSSP